MASSESQSRQKRVLPSRSRRGGPGVGTCDIDMLILDTQKRKGENDPLIPAETRLLLTTNSAFVASSSTSKLDLNEFANERYFDRPEVMKTFRDQQTIETPEFTTLSEDAGVGSRFRPRPQEDHPSTDTSDAVYEKRHRKYELLEKRQRLREKEQLKHEQYKLKERIDQLRSMDAAAFLVLPPSPFSSMSSRPTEPKDDDVSAASWSDLHVNGSPTNHEGERRRKEMLDVALALEERYRTLLLPKGADKAKKNSRQSSVVTSTEPESSFTAYPHPSQDDGESEVEEEEPATEALQEKEKLKLKIKVPPRLASRSMTRTLDSPLYSPAGSSSHNSEEEDELSESDVEQSIPRTRSRKRRKVQSFDTDSSPNGYKRRVSDTLSSPITRKHVPYTSATGKTEYTTSFLLIAALRRFSEPNARKTQRLVTAFGCKVPSEIEQLRDYEVPEWLGLPDHMLAGTSNHVFTETGPPAHIGSILGKPSADANGIAKRTSKDGQQLGAERNADDVP